MSDLISRSQLLKEIEKYKFGAISNDAEREYIKKTILDFIVCQPTAYSIDKVISQLEDYGNEEMDYYQDTPYENCIRECVSKAIEIVKSGVENES